MIEGKNYYRKKKIISGNGYWHSTPSIKKQYFFKRLHKLITTAI